MSGQGPLERCLDHRPASHSFRPPVFVAPAVSGCGFPGPSVPPPGQGHVCRGDGSPRVHLSPPCGQQAAQRMGSLGQSRRTVLGACLGAAWRVPRRIASAGVEPRPLGSQLRPLPPSLCGVTTEQPLWSGTALHGGGLCPAGRRVTPGPGHAEQRARGWQGGTQRETVSCLPRGGEGGGGAVYTQGEAGGKKQSLGDRKSTRLNSSH